MSDDRLLSARVLHQEARAEVSLAKQKRQQRDELIRRVRAEDPRYWTYTRLAGAVGCSPELIAYIVKGIDQSVTL